MNCGAVTQSGHASSGDLAVSVLFPALVDCACLGDTVIRHIVVSLINALYRPQDNEALMAWFNRAMLKRSVMRKSYFTKYNCKICGELTHYTTDCDGCGEQVCRKCREDMGENGSWVLTLCHRCQPPQPEDILDVYESDDLP